MLSFFPLDVLYEIWDLIESVSEDFPTYSFRTGYTSNGLKVILSRLVRISKLLFGSDAFVPSCVFWVLTRSYISALFTFSVQMLPSLQRVVCYLNKRVLLYALMFFTDPWILKCYFEGFFFRQVYYSCIVLIFEFHKLSFSYCFVHIKP